MTITEDRIAPVVPLRRAPRRAPRTASVPGDLHARLLDAANRVLGAAAVEDTTAEDALGRLMGGLINMVPAGGRAPSKHDLVELVERVADRLGCPPASAPNAGGPS